jgi:hypothetical protein
VFTWFTAADAGTESTHTSDGDAAIPAPDGATGSERVVWMQLLDADNNAYYYNTETGESSWERPAELALDAPPLLDGTTVTEQV